MTFEDIHRDMAEKAATLEPLGKTLLFDFGESKMLIDGTADSNTVSVVSDQNIESDCVVRMSLDTYLQLQNKEIRPIMAVASGKVKVKGDMSIATKLKKLM